MESRKIRHDVRKFLKTQIFPTASCPPWFKPPCKQNKVTAKKMRGKKKRKTHNVRDQPVITHFTSVPFHHRHHHHHANAISCKITRGTVGRTAAAACVYFRVAGLKFFFFNKTILLALFWVFFFCVFCKWINGHSSGDGTLHLENAIYWGVAGMTGKLIVARRVRIFSSKVWTFCGEKLLRDFIICTIILKRYIDS